MVLILVVILVPCDLKPFVRRAANLVSNNNNKNLNDGNWDGNYSYLLQYGNASRCSPLTMQLPILLLLYGHGSSFGRMNPMNRSLLISYLNREENTDRGMWWCGEGINPIDKATSYGLIQYNYIHQRIPGCFVLIKWISSLSSRAEPIEPLVFVRNDDIPCDSFDSLFGLHQPVFYITSYLFHSSFLQASCWYFFQNLTR